MPRKSLILAPLTAVVALGAASQSLAAESSVGVANFDFTPAAGLGPGGEWLRPTTIVQPRFARVNLTLSF